MDQMHICVPPAYMMVNWLSAESGLPAYCFGKGEPTGRRELHGSVGLQLNKPRPASETHARHVDGASVVAELELGRNVDASAAATVALGVTT